MFSIFVNHCPISKSISALLIWVQCVSGVFHTSSFTRVGRPLNHTLSAADSWIKNSESELRCACSCLELSGCHGAQYNSQSKECLLETCLNPSVLPEYNEAESEAYMYIREDLNESASKLLARGEPIKILYSGSLNSFLF